MSIEINFNDLVLSNSERYRHLLVWLFVWAFMVSGGLEVGWPLLFSIWTQTPYVLLIIVAFYTTYFYACPWLHKNKTKLIIWHLSIALLYITVYAVLNRLIPEYEAWGQPITNYPISIDIVDTLPFLFLIWVAAHGLYSSKYGVLLAKINSQKAVQLASKQEQLVRQELQFYKSQFNAHLTFNTLSHIYDKVIDQEEAAQSVLLLSDILRYNTTAKVDRPANLNTEISYLRNFIRIHQIIYPQLHIQFFSEGDTQKFEILPRILVSYVENAIKHGVGNDPNFPISIILRVHQTLEFTVTNRVRSGTKAESTQIGLEITRQTLKAYYGTEHQLSIEQQDDTYRIHLVIRSSEEKTWAIAS